MAREQQELRTFHCFAGAGGGILADLMLGHRCVGACEIEEYPRKVLLARQRDGHLPAFPIWDDICTLDGRPWRRRVDLLCGGFPCQDISCAGGRAGAIRGERSVLWAQQLRVACEMGRPYLLMENSPELLNCGIEYILGALSEVGYDARWGVYGSSDVGGMHKRHRLWIFAYPMQIRPRGKPQRRAMEPYIGNDRQAIGELLPFVGGYDGVAGSVGRRGAIGNGQDPRVAATAFRILSQGIIAT